MYLNNPFCLVIPLCDLVFDLFITALTDLKTAEILGIEPRAPAVSTKCVL